MPNEPIEPRLVLIEECIAEATRALEILRSELQISARIESANAREIEKLKRHVAKLQNPEPSEAMVGSVVAPRAS